MQNFHRNSRFLAAVSGGHSGPTSVDTAGARPGVRLVLPIVRAVTVPIVDGRCRESSEDGPVGKASASDGLPLIVGGYMYRRSDQEERSDGCSHAGHCDAAMMRWVSINVREASSKQVTRVTS